MILNMLTGIKDRSYDFFAILISCRMIVISRIINVMEQKFITHQQYKDGQKGN